MRQLRFLVLLVICTGTISCDDLFGSDGETLVHFDVIDFSGELNDVRVRIIEPVPESENSNGNYNVEDVTTKVVTLPGTNSHTFDDIEPGTYGTIIGNNGIPYSEFTLEEGEQVTLTYSYYEYATTTVGNSRSGYYTLPLYRWKCDVTYH